MKRIVISGAGLCGSLLAIALKKLGNEVFLFEKRGDLREHDTQAGKSINLILTAKGMHALDQLGILEDALAFTKPVLGRMMHDLDGNLTYQPYGKDDSEKNYSISRSKLNKFLLNQAQAAGVELSFDSELTEMDLQNSTAHFKSHPEVSYDYFFGADGAGSKTRKILGEKGLVTHSTSPLGTSYKELFMPPDSNGGYAIEESALHIWPRGEHMLMALPNLDGSFTMTIYMTDKRFSDLNSEKKVEGYFNEYFQDASMLMPNYVNDFLEHPSGFLGSLEVSPWVVNNVALIGDAAHAIVPFFGQGMNCSFSDVTYLYSRLKNGEEWSEVLSNYNIAQKNNGNAIRDLSIENFVEMSDTVGKEEFIFRKRVEHIIENEFPEKYRSRYARVVYTLMPYDEAKRLGTIQKEILDELCRGLATPEEVDLKKAEALINEKLP